MLTPNSTSRMLPAMGDFGQYLRLKRIERGYSQRQLAKASGLSSGAVSMIERGDRTELRADTVARLADALDDDFEEMCRHLRPLRTPPRAEPVPA